MNGEFIVLIDNKLYTYTKYEDIPENFDNLIKFKPDSPEPPHTEHQHEQIEEWNKKLQILMEKERASSHKNR
jgi:hypothetical protein